MRADQIPGPEVDRRNPRRQRKVDALAGIGGRRGCRSHHSRKALWAHAGRDFGRKLSIDWQRRIRIPAPPADPATTRWQPAPTRHRGDRRSRLGRRRRPVPRSDTARPASPQWNSVRCRSSAPPSAHGPTQSIGAARTGCLCPPRGWASLESTLRGFVDGEVVKFDAVPKDARPQLADASRLTESLRRQDPTYQSELRWWTSGISLSRDLGVTRSCLAASQRFNALFVVQSKGDVCIASVVGR